MCMAEVDSAFPFENKMSIGVDFYLFYFSPRELVYDFILLVEI